eukprot:Seg868.10 transcript_id=Seg868.10/GoldUCD/mRNA.D3Y31 product="Queuine tRNA-ribosyltransferase accessory subunit 2" protein_id=Seg868.10/GoldUCD/D3Y31
MEFTVVKTEGECRHGMVKLSHNTKGDKNDRGEGIACFETPAVMQYSKYGRIPHLTKDVEGYLPKATSSLRRMRLSELLERSVQESLKSSKKSYKEFTSSDVAATFFCSIQDAAKFGRNEIHKYANEVSVSVWTQSGRNKVTPEAYMEILAASGIQHAECLCDIAPAEETRKRCQKSVDRTLKHLDRCISIKESDPEKYHVDLFGAIVGGDNIKERQRCADETAKRNVKGFVLEGFEQLGNNFTEILLHTLKKLPSDKPRILLGIFSPDQMVDAISCGIDIIDNSYAYDATERGCAIAFEYRHKRPRIHLEAKDEDSVKELEDGRMSFEIDLKDKRLKNDFKPIVSTCSCYTCVQYARAYVNHLLVTNEMLAGVLLMIHNTHHCNSFMSEVRQAIINGTLDEFKSELVCANLL